MAFRRTVTQGFQPDIIHAHVYQAGVPAILLGRLNLIPVVVTEHSSIFPRMMLSSKGVILARFAFQCADAVLPVSNVLKKGIERYGIRADFRVVPNAVDTGLFCPPDGRFEMGKKKLLLVGLLDRSHKKGVPYLLQALAELRRTRNDFQLDIVGDGPARRDYEKMARQLNLSTHVVFHGLKRKREVARFMREADILVLPSLIETFGLVAAEAMACGTPVLATKCGGPEEFLLEGMGTLVPPANAEALREALHDMLIRIDDFDRHGIAQYARERFSRERVGSVLHAIYVSAIHKHRHAA
jgi:glycosyltransferase involved in cell wall biosynthesis